MLTQRELNRALLARQLLLERARLSLPRALERMGGVQAQYAPSMYIGLWSRIDGLERDRLTRALERRTVVQGTLMRGTIHLVAARDYWPFALAIRRARREWWVKTHRNDPSAKELEETAARLRNYLRGGPRRQKEIVSFLGGLDSRRWNGVGLFVDLVRVPPSGTWEQRRADLYAVAEDWLGAADGTPDEGIEHLVRRYLGAFGPAARDDISNWAGLPVSELAPALARVRLRRFRSERGDELLDLPRAPLPASDTPAPVRFLPTWDATLLVHARRTGILPEKYRPLVFNTRTPHSVSTFLVDGEVAGTWRYERGRVVLQPFAPLASAARRELEQEGERLAALHA
ncbi:MAG: winged helix DNA-binding domain-containing protein [Actinomycetota bacterium]|nr:winged helix DNA-binding domain-containing protein [Actinomycetota bacterium]